MRAKKYRLSSLSNIISKRQCSRDIPRKYHHLHLIITTCDLLYVNTIIIVYSVYPAGRYVYFSAAGKAPGSIAQLVTPDLRASAPGPYLVTFWYHAYGDDIGQFEAYEYDGFSAIGPKWSISGSTAVGKWSFAIKMFCTYCKEL